MVLEKERNHQDLMLAEIWVLFPVPASQGLLIPRTQPRKALPPLSRGHPQEMLWHLQDTTGQHTSRDAQGFVTPRGFSAPWLMGHSSPPLEQEHFPTPEPWPS